MSKPCATKCIKHTISSRKGHRHRISGKLPSSHKKCPSSLEGGRPGWPVHSMHVQPCPPYRRRRSNPGKGRHRETGGHELGAYPHMWRPLHLPLRLQGVRGWRWWTKKFPLAPRRPPSSRLPCQGAIGPKKYFAK